jgi:hypothetical protein
VGQGIAWSLFTLAGVYLFMRRGAAETEPPADPVRDGLGATATLSPTRG